VRQASALACEGSVSPQNKKEREEAGSIVRI